MFSTSRCDRTDGPNPDWTAMGNWGVSNTYWIHERDQHPRGAGNTNAAQDNAMPLGDCPTESGVTTDSLMITAIHEDPGIYVQLQ